jgi:hypothetical protein
MRNASALGSVVSGETCEFRVVERAFEKTTKIILKAHVCDRIQDETWSHITRVEADGYSSSRFVVFFTQTTR